MAMFGEKICFKWGILQKHVVILSCANYCQCFLKGEVAVGFVGIVSLGNINV